MKSGALVVIVAIVALFALVPYAAQQWGYDITAAISGETPQTPAQATQEKVATTVCPPGSDTTNTMTIGPMKQKWSPTTSMSTINARVFKISKSVDANGNVVYDTFKSSNDEGSKTDSSTLSVGAQDKMGLIYGYLSAYGSRWIEFTAPCQAFSTGSYITSGKNEIVKNSSSGITFRVKNGYSGLQQDFVGGQNETINQAGVGKFEVTLQTVENEGISAGTDENNVVGNVILIVELNKSTYDETATTFESLSKTTVPSFYTLTNTDSYAVAFVTAGGPDPNQEASRYFDRNLGKLSVTAESGENPVGGSQTIGLGNVKLCVFDEQWSLDTITGAPVFGAEKLKDGAPAGTTAGSYGSEGDCKIFDVT